MDTQIVIIKIAFALFITAVVVGVTMGVLAKYLGKMVQHPFALVVFAIEGVLIFVLAILAIF